MKKKFIFLVLLFATIMAVSVFAQDNQSPLQQGDILISGGLTIGSFDKIITEDLLIGFQLAGDYVLPINFPLTVGLESGFKSSIQTGWTFGGGFGSGSNLIFIPILARVAWHPFFGINKLDTYLMAKAGIGIATLEEETEVAFGFGVMLGVRYFFTEHIGVFAEGGYEHFFVKFFDVDFPANGFATIGITYKF